MRLTHLLFALLAGNLTAQPWNEFRGPAGTGVAAEAKPPVNIGPENLAWKSVRGSQGQSSLVIHGDRLFTTSLRTAPDPENPAAELWTTARDRRNGNVLWSYPAPAKELERVHKSNSPAASTPLVDAERVYVYFGSFGLICYDHDGKEQWRKAIPTPKSLYGTSTSPIDAGTNLILVVDNDNNAPESRGSASKIFCINKRTGETVWEEGRPFHRSGWSTPTIWRHQHGTDLVVLGNGSVVGYAAATGKYKWHVTGFPRETIARPVVAGKHIILSCAHGAVSEETLDPAPFWTAMKTFDTDQSGAIEKDEISKYFTLPFRPELPLDHPGFGMPLPDEPERRKKRQEGLFNHMDKDKDGAITEAELSEGIRGRKGRPRLMAIRPGGEGDITESHVAWEHTKGIPEIPTPLYHKDGDDGRLYLVRNGGLLSCVNAETGEEIYRERLGASGQYRASPVLANGHLYLVSERGSVSVVKAGDAFEKVHSFDLGEPCLATPSIDQNTIYFRTASEIVAFRNSP